MLVHFAAFRFFCFLFCYAAFRCHASYSDMPHARCLITRRFDFSRLIFDTLDYDYLPLL